MRHVAFLHALNRTSASSDDWRCIEAWLHGLRAVDGWARGFRNPMCRRRRRQIRSDAADNGSLRRLAELVHAMSHPSAWPPYVVTQRLLEQAREFHLAMEWELSIDICETVISLPSRLAGVEGFVAAHWQRALSARAGGQLALADTLYDKLLRVAARYESAEFVWRARLGRAHVMFDRGSMPGAEAAIASVLEESRGSRATSQAALSASWRALHTSGVLSLSRNRYQEAIAQIQEALSLCDDIVERQSMVHDIAAGQISLGLLDVARDTLLALRHCAINKSVGWSALVNLMEIAALEGNAESFEAMRVELGSQRMRPWHYAHYLYLAAEGYERLRQLARARHQYQLATVKGEELGVYEVVVRAEARLRALTVKRYLPSSLGPAPIATHRVARTRHITGSEA